MTEQQKRIPVNVEGLHIDVIPREEAMRVVEEMSPELLALTAFRAANSKFHGYAVLDLTTGEMRGAQVGTGEYVYTWRALVPLWKVDSWKASEFPSTLPMPENLLFEEEVEEIAKAEKCEDIFEVDVHDAEKYLGHDEYTERLEEAFIFHHGEDPGYSGWHEFVATARTEIAVFYDSYEEGS